MDNKETVWRACMIKELVVVRDGQTECVVCFVCPRMRILGMMHVGRFPILWLIGLTYFIFIFMLCYFYLYIVLFSCMYLEYDL